MHQKLEEVGCGYSPVAVVAFDVGGGSSAGGLEGFCEAETVGC